MPDKSTGAAEYFGFKGPVSDLSPGERALFENPELFRHTVQGLAEYTACEGISSDWLFENEQDDGR